MAIRHCFAVISLATLFCGAVANTGDKMADEKYKSESLDGDLKATQLVINDAGLVRKTKNVSFAEGKWDKGEWIVVKSARWPEFGHWVQKADHIENSVPLDADEIKWQGARAPETYASMLWNTKLHGNFKVSSTMDFDFRMAPLIVLAPSFGRDANGFPEYREHWEIIIYDEGINVWHHQNDGKPTWHLAAQLKIKYEPKRKYELKVQVKREKAGAQIIVDCGGASFSYMEHDLPQELFAGITGCEGINRFYDFKVEYEDKNNR